MAFTRKHYKAIAGIIKNRVPQAKNAPARLRIEHIANDFADLFESESIQFNRDKFLSACGIE